MAGAGGPGRRSVVIIFADLDQLALLWDGTVDWLRRDKRICHSIFAFEGNEAG
jgi:hypothetical protein